MPADDLLCTWETRMTITSVARGGLDFNELHQGAASDAMGVGSPSPGQETPQEDVDFGGEVSASELPSSESGAEMFPIEAQGLLHVFGEVGAVGHRKVDSPIPLLLGHRH